MSHVRIFTFSTFFAVLFLFIFVFPAKAAITQDAPPIDVLFQGVTTVGGGSVVPLARFRLVQTGGSDTLTKVGIKLVASTTITQGEISRVSLWKESGATPGFQLSQDTLVDGAASTSPLVDGTLIVLTPSTPVAIGSVSTEFFIVASTSAVAVLKNNDGFDIRMQDNYASSSAPSGIGTAFAATKKIVFQQSAPLKISEIKLGATGNTEDEFVELYNSGESDVNLVDLPLNFYLFNALGGAQKKTLTYNKRIIPSHGYFLIGSATNYSSLVPLDATYDTITGGQFTLIVDGAVAISTSSVLLNATSSKIDLVCWGNQPGANCENKDTISVKGAPLNLQDGTSMERLALGYPDATSTAQSMAQGGADSTKGNSVDHDDNSAEFVVQATANPQNSASPSEFPFGGGVPDSSTLQVAGSFPSNNQTNVPIDLSYIGFGFNKIASSSTINPTTVTLTTGGGSNLCSSVMYNPFPSSFEPPVKCVLSGRLSPNITYTFTVTTGVQDLATPPNSLDQDAFQVGNQTYVAVFTTGGLSQTFSNTIPPTVLGTSPFPGSTNIPTNIAKIAIEFSSDMIVSTLNSTNLTLTSSGGSVVLSNFTMSTSTGRNILTATPASLSANTAYILTIGAGVQNLNGLSLPMPYISVFTTGSGTDLTPPVLIGTIPTPATTITANTNDFLFSFDDNIDSTTATSGSVTLAVSGGSKLPGIVRYDPVAKEGHFTPNNVLPLGQTLVLTLVGASIKNVSGVLLGTDITRNWTVEASNSDITPPAILFANGDEFNLAITFNEAVNSTDAITLANYSITVGGVAQTLSALAGTNLIYDASTHTAKIFGLHFTSGAQFVVTVQNLRDISGNLMITSSQFTGTIKSALLSGGILGPGDSGGSFGPKINDFSSSGIGFMPGMKVMPMNAFVSASTTYGFDLPISKRIPINGKIIITFPSSSDYGLCCAVTTSADNPFITAQNSDINGPGDGAVNLASISKDSLAKTIILTLGVTTQISLTGDTHDFLRFAINDIKNPSLPKGMDSSGYSFDVKTQSDTGVLLESFTSNPVYISGGAVGGSATTTISGTVSGNGANLAGVTIRMMSPQVGMLSATTNGAGVYQFTNVPANNTVSSFGGAGTGYYFSTDPVVNPTGTTTAFFGEPMPTPVSATSTSLLTRNFSLTATSSAINFAVKLTGDNSLNGIFSANEQIDIFAGGPGRFIVQTYTTTATIYNATSVITLPLPQVNGNWGVGIGPAMPKAMGSLSFGPPPAPNWAVPKPVNVVVSGCPGACTSTIDGSSATSYTFTVSAANRTISGVLKDTSGNAISSAEVFAFSAANGVGNHAQTSPTGVFSIKVTDGSYNVGAFIPGVGRSREVPVVISASGFFVDGATTLSTGSSGANPFNITITKSTYTITGRVTDGTNAVSNAPVFAYRTDAPGHIDAITGSDGNYTLYVDNGTWKVNSFIPGFGPMSEQTVIISGASQASINFSPSTATSFKTISGTIFESADATVDPNEGISGAIIRVSGSSGSNEAITGSDGTFSIRVPSGSYAIVDIFKSGYGKIPPLDQNLAPIVTIDASSDVSKLIRVNSRKTITIIIKDSNGNPLTVSKAFIDLFDATKNFGNHAEITNGTTTTLQIANGASTTIRAVIQGVPPANVSVASDDIVSAYPNNTLVLSGVLEVNSNEKIKITVNTSTAGLSTVSGTVYAGSATPGNELANAWVQFVDPTNNVLFGTQATSSGIYVISLSNGTYQVQAMKSGYISTPVSMTITAATSTANITVIQAASTITGTITIGSAAASDAFVWAEKLGGGFASTKTNTSGVYSLSVDSGQWRVFATADGYQKKAYASNPVLVGTTGVNISFSSSDQATSLSSKTATSNSFTDTSVGSFSDSTVGVGVSLDSGALGSAGNTAYLSAKQTSNIPQTLDTTIIANKGIDIDATSGSSAVTTLKSGKNAEITITYTKSELASSNITTTSGVGGLKISSWSDETKAWESLTTIPTYKDSNGNPVSSPGSDLSNVTSVSFTTTGASHFSAYALTNPSDASAPSTPSGLTLLSRAVGSSHTVVLSWNANTESDLAGYYIYRDTSSSGTFPLLKDAGNVTTYTDGSVSGGSTYYYKISAYDTGANESAASSYQTVSITASASDSTSSGGSSGGGGGSPSLGQTTPISTTPIVSSQTPTVTTAPSTQVAQASLLVQPSVIAQVVSPVFNTDLELGNKSDEIRRLQELIKKDKDVYPEGIVSGYFGSLTVKAVKRFQEKYGLPAVGRVGPATRAKLAEVFGKEKPTESVSSAKAANSISRNLGIGSQGDEIKLIQGFLAKYPEFYPSGKITGYFGLLTQQAIGNFQEKYGIANKGELGYGRVGPKTRAKFNELMNK